VNPPGTPALLLPSLPPQARILIVRLRSIGDIVLLTPALQLLKNWRPDLRVSVLIEGRFRDLLEANPDIDELLQLDARQGWKKVLARLRMVRELRRRKFSVCLNLHGGPTSAFFTATSGARWKLGFQHFRNRWAYDLLVPDARTFMAQEDIHSAELQAAALVWFGMPRTEVPAARLFVRPAHEEWWGERRAQLGIAPDQAYALLNPASRLETRQWPPERFAQIGVYLRNELGLLPLYHGGPGESATLDAVERAAVTSILRLENLTLSQLAAALKGARLFVGNDSGPAHMAAALKRPSVVIFGSMSPKIWGPWPPQGSGRYVQNSFVCNPCPGYECRRFAQPECILSVTVEQVIETIKSVLA
jgi:heptosyltransferase III